MNEITQTNLNIIPAEDIEYLTKQSTAEIGKIVAGMTSLMRDTDARVDQLESQGWFQRMCKTVTGSNKASREVIQQNNAKMGAYMAEAVSVLYDRQLIDEKLITNLGLQISMLYADHVQMKKQLGAFTSRIDNLLVQTFETFEALGKKLNKKIESVDNFHLLVEEINLGHYTQLAPVLAICEITSLFDERILREERKLNILREALEKQDIINDNEIAVTDYLNDIFKISAENIGQIVMELGTICEKSPLAQLMLGIVENYHYLPDMAKKMKKRSAIIDGILDSYDIDADFSVSTKDIYNNFVSSKVDILEGLCPIEINAESQGRSLKYEEVIPVNGQHFSDGGSNDKFLQIRKLCEDFLKDTHNWDTSFLRFDYRKFELLNTVGAQNDDVYLCCDATLSQCGTVGYAITNNGLYCSESFLFNVTTHHYTFETLSVARIVLGDDDYISINGTTEFGISTINHHTVRVVELLKKIITVWNG